MVAADVTREFDSSFGANREEFIENVYGGLWWQGRLTGSLYCHCDPLRSSRSRRPGRCAPLGVREPPPETAVAKQWGVFDRYCTECHNDADLAGEPVAGRRAAAGRGGACGGLGKGRSQAARRPDAAAGRCTARERPGGRASSRRSSPISTISRAKRGPQPGRVPLHRLNRTEYATAVEDLLAVRIDVGRNVAGRYLERGVRQCGRGVARFADASRSVHRGGPRHQHTAVGNPAPDPARADYRSDQANKTRHVDGLPLGTRDGLVVEHDFPADGDYELNLTISSIPGSELRGYPYGWLEYAHEVVVTLDGVSVFTGSIGGTEDSLALDQRQIQGVDEIRNRFRDIRVPVTAGPREVGAAFVARSFAEGDYLLAVAAAGRRRTGRTAAVRHGDHRTVQPYGNRGADTQPGTDLHLHAANRNRRAAVRRADSARTSRTKRSAVPSMPRIWSQCSASIPRRAKRAAASTSAYKRA